MTTEFVWLMIGWATAGPLIWVGFVAWHWWADRVRRVELDDYTARLRALDRRPGRVP